MQGNLKIDYKISYIKSLKKSDILSTLITPVFLLVCLPFLFSQKTFILTVLLIENKIIDHFLLVYLNLISRSYPKATSLSVLLYNKSSLFMQIHFVS
jgi:hypothetical protein